MVTDPVTGRQYDLSSLAKSEDDEDANWSVVGDTVAGKVCWVKKFVFRTYCFSL